MSADIKSLKSYLVSLGFDANEGQYLKFENKLKQAANLVKSSTFTMGVDLLKWQVAVAGLFVGISSAVIDSISKVASADQEYRLFGQRMFLNTQQARSLKIALDALGQPLEAIAFDPELHGRYEQLKKDQILLAGGLGGDYEGTMRQIRDVTFEFTRMEVEFKYFTMSVAKDIFQALGGGDFVTKLHSLNDWIITNIPRWSKTFSTYLVPVLKDTWHILEDIGIILIKLEPLIDKVLRIIGWILDKSIKLIDFTANNPGLVGGAALGGKIGSFFGPEGALAGTAIGGLTGLGYDSLTGGMRNAPRGSSGAGSGGIAEQARALAAQVGPQLGVDPSIIFAQWAHETGNFTNRGATQLNNLAGINVSGGNGSDYKPYSSLNEFAQDYSSLIQRRYKGALGAGNVDDYATALKRGGYFSGQLNDYERGMKSFQGSYSGGGSSTHVGSITVNVNGSNATPDEIKNKVIAALQEHTALQTKRSLAQTRSVYA